MESAAFRVPTVTSDLAGFGLWVNTLLKRDAEIEDGVKVVHRTDDNWNDAAADISLQIEKWVAMSEAEREAIRKKAGAIAQKALWKHFIKYYLDAYDFAINKKDAIGDSPLLHVLKLAIIADSSCAKGEGVRR